MTAEKHSLVVTTERGKFRSGCACGWRALGLDKSDRGAAQAWSAHMYAQGFRTREAIEAAA